MLNAGMFSSATPEWYTPDWILERVGRVLDGIDLDPCADGERHVPARCHYTVQDDGLSRSWIGTVFVNPPYGRVIGAWTGKLLAEVEAGHVTAAIALVPARTDTSWFEPLHDYPVCYLRGRVRFSGHETGAPFPSALVYLGPNTARFAAEFVDVGRIVVPLRLEAA